MRILKCNTLFDCDRIPKVDVVWRKNVSDISKLDTPGEVAILFELLFQLSRQTEEYVYMLCLNNKNKPICIFEIGHGTVGASFASARELYMKALLVGAVKIALIHNHPSGETKPSKDDIACTKRMNLCGRLLSVKFLDSIIVGESWYSMQEHMPELFATGGEEPWNI